jgi:hypothetical protein
MGITGKTNLHERLNTMNQGGYFGAYRGGFQTLPANAYQMMTAPTKQNSETIKNAASAIGSMVQKYADQQAGDQAFEQGSAAQYQGLESMSQATGVPMNPELANQYMNMGEMSTPQQQAAFQQSLNQELQRQQMLYGIANQQRQMQQGLYNQDVISRGLSAPFYSGGAGGAGVVPAMPQTDMGVSLPLPQYNTGPRVNFPQYQRGY